MIASGMFLMMTACSGPQMINGTVRDIWNAPLQDVGVRLGDNTATTNAQGNFSIIAGDGLLTVAKGGYIPDETTIEFDPEEESPLQNFNLYPKPKTPGFHAVGQKDYVKIEAQGVEEKNTTHKLVRGLRNLGEVRLNNKNPTFVYHAEIRKSEVKQLRLKLHRLEYLDSDRFLHIQGREEVHVGLNVAEGDKVPFFFEEFPIEDYYKITFDEPLTRGSYAFNTDNIMTEKKSSRNKRLPEELQRAYPFDIKK